MTTSLLSVVGHDARRLERALKTDATWFIFPRIRLETMNVGIFFARDRALQTTKF